MSFFCQPFITVSFRICFLPRSVFIKVLCYSELSNKENGVHLFHISLEQQADNNKIIVTVHVINQSLGHFTTSLPQFNCSSYSETIFRENTLILVEMSMNYSWLLWNVRPQVCLHGLCIHLLGSLLVFWSGCIPLAFETSNHSWMHILELKLADITRQKEKLTSIL